MTSQETTSTEVQRRDGVRKRAMVYLQLVDPDNGEDLGRLVNVSANGFLVSHPGPFAEGQTLKFGIVLPRAMGGGTVTGDSVCRWTRHAEGDQFHRSGFQFVEITQEGLDKLEVLGDLFTFEGGSILDPPKP